MKRLMISFEKLLIRNHSTTVGSDEGCDNDLAEDVEIDIEGEGGIDVFDTTSG